MQAGLQLGIRSEELGVKNLKPNPNPNPVVDCGLNKEWKRFDIMI